MLAPRHINSGLWGLRLFNWNKESKASQPTGGFLAYPGIGPIKSLQRKIYATLFFKSFDWALKIFKHLDWLKFLRVYSKCLKNSIVENFRCKIIIGPVPGFEIKKSKRFQF